MMQRSVLAIILLIIGSLLASCDPSTPDSPTVEGSEEIPVGGVLSIAGARRLDFLDPAAMYSSSSWFLARGIYRTLVTFPADSNSKATNTVVPDLATDTGTPNEDATQWVFTLKSGVKFGPAVGGREIEGVTGAEITSFDVKYAIERLFNTSVEAGYSFHFEILKGISDFVAGKSEGIAGIETTDEKTIIFHLDEPAGDWPQRLALAAASPVPQSYASQFDETERSNYNSHVVASGPYYVEEWIPYQKVVLARNPHWDPDTDDVREAYVDGVEWEFGYEPVEDTAPALVESTVDLVHGARSADLNLDTAFDQRIVTEPSACTRYIWVNTKIEPFDDPLVRKAVNYALDRASLQRIHGGPKASQIATSILPPAMTGHLMTQDFNPFLTKGMKGDLAKAKKIISRSGHPEGFTNPLKLFAGDTEEDMKLARSIATDLKGVGFSKIKIKSAKLPDLYTKYYGDPTSEVAIGTSAGWCRDYNDPATFFEPLFGSAGGNIDDNSGEPTEENFNYSQLKDRELKKAIQAAQETLPGPERAAAWEEVNRLATSSSAIIPWAWDNEEIVYNETLVNPLFNPSLSHIDWVVAGIRR